MTRVVRANRPGRCIRMYEAPAGRGERQCSRPAVLVVLHEDVVSTEIQYLCRRHAHMYLNAHIYDMGDTTITVRAL